MPCHPTLLLHDEPAHARAGASPIPQVLRPELEWETTGSATNPTQTPWVVFTDGVQQVGIDEFVLWYGGGDTNVGAARIKVHVPTVVNGAESV